jgi:DNA mismatch repair protein MutS
VQRAKEVLHQLEAGETSGKADRLVDDLPLFSAVVRKQQPEPAASDALGGALAALNLDEMTPREALEALYRLKELTAKRAG